MKCAWAELMAILPTWIRNEVDLMGRDTMQELRLRLGYPPELVSRKGSRILSGIVDVKDLNFVINTASQYSPWSAATMADGYLTAPGGHRLGICGEAVMKNGKMTGIRRPVSICLRVARDFSGELGDMSNIPGSVLIIGCPGSGKTTLLRELIRQRSDRGKGSIAVVDERGELFPSAADFSPGPKTDVMSGCTKQEGLQAVLRTMGPQTVAVDEITADQDCEALLHAAWCGVSLIATAHAGSIRDLRSRQVYQPLIANRIFDTLITLQPDKSWKAERMVL